MMKRFAQLTIVVATVAACGCADAGTAGTAPPAGLVGTFTVASYNGDALPTHLNPTLGACSSMIVSGSLTTASDGRVVFTRAYTTPCVKGAPVATEARPGTVSVDGTAITIALDPDVLNAAQVYHGTLDGGQLTLRYTATSLAAPADQVFVLVRQ